VVGRHCIIGHAWTTPVHGLCWTAQAGTGMADGVDVWWPVGCAWPSDCLRFFLLFLLCLAGEELPPGGGGVEARKVCSQRNDSRWP
jgi:hypothetical protein